jgi:hypothetical protein
MRDSVWHGHNGDLTSAGWVSLRGRSVCLALNPQKIAVLCKLTCILLSSPITHTEPALARIWSVS